MSRTRTVQYKYITNILGRGQVRLVRASTVVVRKPSSQTQTSQSTIPPPAHSQFRAQPVRGMVPGPPGQSQPDRGMVPGPTGPPWPSASIYTARTNLTSQLRAAPAQVRVRTVTAPQRFHQVGSTECIVDKVVLELPFQL